MRKHRTVLDVARDSEAFAKAAMEKAKESFRLAHAAYDAIGVTVAQLEAAEDNKAKGAAEILAGICSVAPTCANWIGFCLQIGWPKESVPNLEKLWQEHHDANDLVLQPST